MKVEAVAQQVEDTVLADHVGGGIDEEWETEVEPAGQRHDRGSLVGADGDDLGVEALYPVVGLLQLNELPTAVDSPGAAVKDEHDVALASVGGQGHVIADNARKGEVGRHRPHLGADRRDCSWRRR